MSVHAPAVLFIWYWNFVKVPVKPVVEYVTVCPAATDAGEPLTVPAVAGVQHEIVADHPAATVATSVAKTKVRDPSAAVEVIVPGLVVPDRKSVV